ncbi:hypothetical protein H8N03_23745 [Ramlibacter sp. USB13]|uniref:Uncharacterized protein n=1 Tax=Ramlibacter cellulosilyticus TaxID=2764187 RepID=A0A923MU89_9BURK|nr:hypothetical protein [Ramlibacter cellulosilyticus]MBC5785972.1 hypothetical protein [Ramlibacter cellulosilyticus]
MIRTSFDALVARLAASPTTLSERELLEPSHWSLGEDARLREDLRFRETPWGRWMLAEDFVANDVVYRWLHAERRGSVALDAALKRAGEVFGRRCVFCANDPRFVLRHDEVHLAASELSRQPVIEDKVGDLEKYRTHLPLHTLKAAAASEPAGEWGKRAQDQVIETLGWVRVSLPGRRLNDRMFIAAIEGNSMDDGKSGLVDGAYAVFELWPSGSKQNLSVLVRGAFFDPETSNYAVKKYVADLRDEEGHHKKVSLVSLNPNKERYPSIELQPEDDDDITVVAKVVQALSADDYERRPKAKRRVGRRDLTNDEQAASLGRRVASFFDGTASDAEDEGTTGTESTGWQARLVCLDVAAGGLHLEIGPLEGLPPFVKKLRVVGSHDWDGFVLAANARTRPARVPVRPGMGPWRWEAVGFEEEQDLGVEKLALDVLAATTPVVFRVDAEGVGQHIKSKTLSIGQAYRLLLPPGVGSEVGVPLNDGWRIWSLDLATQLSPTTREVLTSIGLEVGEAWPRLEWALAPAASWRTNARGDSYPVFETGTELLVHVSGIAADDGDEAVLFLHGASGTERLPLSTSGLVSLGAPTAGRWACALLHSRTSVQSTTLLFEVAEDAREDVAASSSAVAHSGLPSLEAAAPPGWPITLRWLVFAAYEETLAILYGNEDGTVSVDDVASIIEVRAARTRVADLVVDFGELGRRVLPHDGRASLKQVREQLTDLWQQRSGLVQSRQGAWLQLRNAWFEPVTELFGYGLEEAALLADVEAPHDLTAWGLTVDERVMGSITRSPSRVLVLTTDIDAVLRDHRKWIDSACSAAKVRDAIITDGARWTTHRKGSQQLKQQVWSLDQAIAHGSIDEMLGDLAEGL